MEVISLSTETEKIIFAKLSTLEDELSALRQGFIVVNRKYSEVLTSLKKLSELTVEATHRASASACRAENAAKKAAETAKIAASQSTFKPPKVLLRLLLRLHKLPLKLLLPPHLHLRLRQQQPHTRQKKPPRMLLQNQRRQLGALLKPLLRRLGCQLQLPLM